MTRLTYKGTVNIAIIYDLGYCENIACVMINVAMGHLILLYKLTYDVLPSPAGHYIVILINLKCCPF